VTLAARRTALLLATLSLAACSAAKQSPEPVPAPTASTEWPTAYASAMSEVRESRYSVADRTLAEFAQRYPDSPEAAEVPFWRAVYKIDPTNSTATKEAAALLDAYLAAAPSGQHRLEATTFRKLITALEARSAALAMQSAAPTVPRAEEKALQEEVNRLRDELSKANAELTRIRRRVARPKQ